MFMSQAASRFRFHRPSVQLRSPFGDDWFGQRAESYARFDGKMRYLLMQTVLVLSWVAFNAMGTFHYDPYPFILLNLVFSTQAAYAAPMILLAQNRQADRDRAQAETDRAVNARTQADTEFLARELASVRLALAGVATTEDLTSAGGGL